MGKHPLQLGCLVGLQRWIESIHRQCPALGFIAAGLSGLLILDQGIHRDEDVRAGDVAGKIRGGAEMTLSGQEDGYHQGGEYHQTREEGDLPST